MPTQSRHCCVASWYSLNTRTCLGSPASCFVFLFCGSLFFFVAGSVLRCLFSHALQLGRAANAHIFGSGFPRKGTASAAHRPRFFAASKPCCGSLLVQVLCEPKWLAQSGIRKMSHDLRVLCFVFVTHNAQQFLVCFEILGESLAIGGGTSPASVLFGIPCFKLLGAALTRIGGECLRNLPGIWNCSWLVRSNGSILHHCTKRFWPSICDIFVMLFRESLQTCIFLSDCRRPQSCLD